MNQDDIDAGLHQQQQEEEQQFKIYQIKPAYCDYIAHKIKETLMKPDNSIVMGCSSVKYDINNEGMLVSTKKTIDVIDLNRNVYRVTVEEVCPTSKS